LSAPFHGALQQALSNLITGCTFENLGFFNVSDAPSAFHSTRRREDYHGFLFLIPSKMWLVIVLLNA